MMILSEVMTQIAHLKKKSQTKDKEIYNLYLALEEISLKKQSITHPSLISYNFLHKLRVDIIDSIMIFLDLHDLLQFRLVSNSANKFILVILLKKIQVLQNQCQVLESEFQDFQQAGQLEYSESEEMLLLEQARNNLNQIYKEDINELRSIISPPWQIQKALKFVQILVDPNYNPAQASWRSSKQMLQDYEFIQKVTMLDIDQITDKQVQLLQEVHEIQLNQIKYASKAAGLLFEFVQSVLSLFESQTYREKQKLQTLQKKQKLINELNKLIKEN